MEFGYKNGVWCQNSSDVFVNCKYLLLTFLYRPKYIYAFCYNAIGILMFCWNLFCEKCTLKVVQSIISAVFFSLENNHFDFNLQYVWLDS